MSRVLVAVLAVPAFVLVTSLSQAQLDQAISDQDLLEPWTRSTAILSAIPPDMVERLSNPQAVGKRLDQLHEDLGALGKLLEDTAVRIVARPEFSYDAAQASHDLSLAVGKAGAGLEALFADLAPQGDPEMKGAHDMVEKLRIRLAERTWFERDVMRTVGSGSKHAIQDLARRWWTAGERVEDLQSAVAALRKRLA